MERAGSLIGKLKLSPEMADPETRARAAWALAAGKKIARHTLAAALVRGTLVVEVEDFVWQKQLNTLRHFLLRNLKEILGGDVVTEIDFRPMPKRIKPQRAESAASPGLERNPEDPVNGRCSIGSQRRGILSVKITEQEVRRVAELANLALTEDEIVRMTQDMDGILTHIDKLSELDTSNVEPMSQVLYDAEETATLRADIERKPLGNADALANAPVSGQGYFKVPLVIEK